ncbi:MAG TPA: hypothetical protein VMV69_22235 [Pirellulales bacterium]|nr:hypothetical protein [Pirellulales bacterium]
MPHATHRHDGERTSPAVPTLGDEIRESAHEASDRVKQLGAAIVQEAQDKVDAVRERAADYLEQGTETVCRVGRSLDERVRAQPVKALLIAAGVGALLGVVWARRR